MRIEYVPREFKAETEQIIEYADQVLNEYATQGYILTVRALYYKFVTRDLFPEDRRWRLTKTGRWVKDPNGTKNATPNYKWLGEIITNSRLAGYIDWDMLEDRTRKLEKVHAWKNPMDLMNAALEQYHLARWGNQEYRPEVWLEKDALIGIIEDKCKKLDVPYIACKGYMSQSGMWKAAQRMIKFIRDGYKPVIFHLGDHDPSGLDMSQDIVNRLDLFIEYESFVFGTDWMMERIALNMDQIRINQPPPQPAKPGDSRSREYEKKYGPDCWELDSMEPEEMNTLIEDHVKGLIDQEKWDEVENLEAEHKEAMQKAIGGMKL